MHRPFYGVLFAPTFVLAAYSGQPASPIDLLRPLAAFAIAAAVAFGLLGALTRRWHAASLIVSFGLIGIVRMEFLLLVLAWLFLAWRGAKRTGSWVSRRTSAAR